MTNNNNLPRRNASRTKENTSLQDFSPVKKVTAGGAVRVFLLLSRGQTRKRTNNGEHFVSTTSPVFLLKLRTSNVHKNTLNFFSVRKNAW